jgi:ribosomal protein S9
VGVIARVRALAVGIAKAYMSQQSSADEKSEEEPATDQETKHATPKKQGRNKETVPVA